MSANFTPSMNTYKDLGQFRFWCQKVLPVVYDDSLSYYELLCKVVNYLNETIQNVEYVGEDMHKLYTAYNELQGYVNTYFADLNVQNEINTKLNLMASDGSLSALIKPLFDAYKNVIDDTVDLQNDMIDNIRGLVEANNEVVEDEIGVLTARMNQFTALGEGATTGDAELMDIRVGANGVTYPSAGEAVRQQMAVRNMKCQKVTKIPEVELPLDEVKRAIEEKGDETLESIPEDYTALVEQVNQLSEENAELKSDIDNLNELDFSKVLTIKDEYVDQSGVITPYKTWARTDYLPVPKGNILKIKTPNLISMYDSNYNCFYDKDKKFISYFKTVMNKENRISIPYEAAYYILSGEYKDLMTQIKVQKKITLNVEENSDRILNNGVFVNKSLYTHFTRIGENKYIFREFKRYEVNYILDLYRMYIGHIENNSPVEDEEIGTSLSDVIGPVSICNTLTGTYSWSGGVHGIKIGETTYPTAESVSVKLFCDGKEITNDGFYIGIIRIIAENDLYFPQTITGHDRTDATKAIREKRVYTLTNKMNVKVFLSTYNDCYINYYYGCQCLTYDMTDIYLPNNELHTSYSEISDYVLFNKREQKYYCSKDNRHYDVEVCPFGLGSYYLNDGSNPSYKFGNIASFRKIYHQFIANNTKVENNKCLMWEANYNYYID